MFLGMAFLIMRTPAYDAYGDAAREHGMTPLSDQQIAGGMMIGLDLLVMFFALACSSGRPRGTRRSERP